MKRRRWQRRNARVVNRVEKHRPEGGGQDLLLAEDRREKEGARNRERSEATTSIRQKEEAGALVEMTPQEVRSPSDEEPSRRLLIKA